MKLTIMSSFLYIMTLSTTVFAQEQTFDGIEFVQITGETYLFGSARDQEGRLPFEEVFELPLNHSFWIGKYEITQAQWRSLMGENPSVHQNLGPIEDYPVDSVSWEDIQRFVDRLNSIAGGEFYRLPTEAEWEFVAKANHQSRWFFGDHVQDLSIYAYNDNNPLPREIGGKEANPFGVYDLYGNLYEWVEDWYMVNRPPEFGACPPIEGTHKVIRGGSNASAVKYTRSASRNFAPPSQRSSKIGFRLVRVLNPAEDQFKTGDRCIDERIRIDCKARELTTIFSADASTLLLLEFNGDMSDTSGRDQQPIPLRNHEYTGTCFGQGLVLPDSDPQGFDWSAYRGQLQHPFTIEMVINPTTTACWQKLLSHNDGSDAGLYYCNGINFFPNGGGGPLASIDHYIAYVSTSANTANVYVNAQFHTELTTFTNPTHAIFFRDDSHTGRNEQLDAVVDAMRISQGTRSMAEIQAVQERLATQNP